MNIAGRSNENIVQLARSYAANARPTRVERQQFTALMKAQFPLLGDEAKQQIANVLCLCHNLDATTVTLIADAPANVCGRFLRFNPLLDAPALTVLVLNGDFQHRLSIARRQDLPRSVARLLRDTQNSDINRALDLRQKPNPVEPVAVEATQSTSSQLIDAARRRDVSTMCTLLMQKLSISQESAFLLLADKSSANLIIALKFCGFSCNDAWETYGYLAPGLADAEGQKANFIAAFEMYDHVACARTVRGWIMDDLIARVTMPSAANDTVVNRDDLMIDAAVDLLKSA